jgi:hypothetical protein
MCDCGVGSEGTGKDARVAIKVRHAARAANGGIARNLRRTHSAPQ